MKRWFLSCVKLVLVAVLGVSSVTVEARRFLESGLVQIPRNQTVAVADFFEKFGSRLGLGPSDTMHPDRQRPSGAKAKVALPIATHNIMTAYEFTELPIALSNATAGSAAGEATFCQISSSTTPL